jgi:hypothetical protein
VEEVRRRFDGGSELAVDSLDCDMRCDRSHSKVHVFFVFAQLLHADNGPKTSIQLVVYLSYWDQV